MRKVLAEGTAELREELHQTDARDFEKLHEEEVLLGCIRQRLQEGGYYEYQAKSSRDKAGRERKA